MQQSNEELTKVQKELEQQCYLSSEQKSHDMRGEMEYCDKCVFKVLDKDAKKFVCDLDYNSMSVNCVCAKKYLRRIKNDETKKI